MIEAVEQFTDDRPPEDDRTLLVAKVCDLSPGIPAELNESVRWKSYE